MNNTIRVFWQSPRNTNEGDFDNFGDVLARDLVFWLSGRKVLWRRPKDIRWYHVNKRIYLTVGSIIKRSNKYCEIWGSGIKERNCQFKGVKKIHAVRGPQTASWLRNKGFQVPESYGDPALLCPLIWPKALNNNESKIGIIPHYIDLAEVSERLAIHEKIDIIDLRTDKIENVINQINACDYILSSSLHGLIVSHAYGKPAKWVEFSDKVSGDGVKFEDYFESMELGYYYPHDLKKGKSLVYDELIKIFHEESQIFKPTPEIVLKLQKQLLASCPFNYRNREVAS